MRAQYDEVVLDAVNAAEAEIERLLNCNVLSYYGELRTGMLPTFRAVVEGLASSGERRDAVAICLTTPGGQAEAVEKMVNILRHHYQYIYAIVPRAAMSAGTILCMAADKIYMDYYSSLGPVDPQVPDRENQFLVPALGYLDKVDELIEKSRANTITPAEYQLLQNQDLAMLRLYEQSRDLSVSLLKKWLTDYKFKDWHTHRTTNPGTPVTAEEKLRRAEFIAHQLSNNNLWHSHGRMIGIDRLDKELRLEIEDYGKVPELSAAIRLYSDTLTEYLERQGIESLIFSRYTV